MPAYDYECDSCEFVFEIRHSMGEKPVVICPSCKSRKTRRVFNPPGLVIKTGGTNSMSKAYDQVKRNVDMKQEMKEEVGIEEFHGLGGSTVKQVYDDTMAQKSKIKEDFSKQREVRQKESQKKLKEWKVGAAKRTPERARIKAQKRAEADAKKRAVTVGV